MSIIDDSTIHEYCVSCRGFRSDDDTSQSIFNKKKFYIKLCAVTPFFILFIISLVITINGNEPVKKTLIIMTVLTFLLFGWSIVYVFYYDNKVVGTDNQVIIDTS